MMKKVRETNDNPTDWYLNNKEVFEQLAFKVESILTEIISDNKISFHAINSRAKDIISFSEKINNAKYDDPINQITDFAGIRIIAYVENDLEKISKLVEQNFDIDHENSIDKTKSLGTDKVGYRSIHYVAKLTKNRIILPEYGKFEGLFFEIQIRTILQHAWAEIEHDKDYKFSGELPVNIKRRFKVLSGVLELADREFDALATEIDIYKKEVTQNTKSGNLNIELNSTSLDAFMDKRFSSLFKGKKTTRNNDPKRIIQELRNFGIDNIEQLDKIVNDTIIEKIIKNDDSNTLPGILRSVMMLNNIEKYFKSSWNKNWSAISSKSYNFLKNEGIEIDKYLQDNNIRYPMTKRLAE